MATVTNTADFSSCKWEGEGELGGGLKWGKTEPLVEIYLVTRQRCSQLSHLMCALVNFLIIRAYSPIYPSY